MAKNLLIVESPAKAKTINKILGKDFEVTSSMGHLCDLPKSRLGVDVEHDFEPQYIVIQKRRKLAKQVQEEARGKVAIYLAPDPDREGEAISWHIARLLQQDDDAQAKKATDKAAKQAAKDALNPEAAAEAAKKKAKKSKKAGKGKAEANGHVVPRKIYRISFHEITAQAIKAAILKPTEIDLNKVNSQQARRVLDRLVGYSLSPLLWKKIGRGLSAGRVQSVTLRLIVDREKEIEAFKPEEYWSIIAELKQGNGPVFKAQLDKLDGKKLEIKTQAQAEELLAKLRQQTFSIEDVEQKEQKRYPKPPFITSTLQQEAFHKLGYSSARTMRIAQQLYEGLELGDGTAAGLITYMRTDSVRVANEAMDAVRALIPDQFGKPYLPDAPRAYKSRKAAQEAHEAVRPTDVRRTPESVRSYLTDEQLALYQLIWQRFVASQMSDAVDHLTAARIAAGPFHLKANGRTNLFAGWTKAYEEVEEKEQDEEQRLPEGLLPPLKKGDNLTLVDSVQAQHFTKPPRRFTDASLVKALEEAGVGRPSTYAPTIQTIVGRDYVRRQGGSLVPTQLGRTVTEMLVEHFPEIMDLKFTADMEDELDHVEDGSVPWVSVVRNFYTPFSSRVTVANEKMREVKREVIPTEHVCEKCGKQMVIKWGRFGQFLSCSAYPDCKNAKAVPTGVKCPQEGCGGDMVERRARGRVFYGCSHYPNCRYTARKLPAAGETLKPTVPGAVETADPDEENGNGQTT